MESLDFFSRAHEVPIENLLEELRLAQSTTDEAKAPVATSDPIADTIYQPFFKAGIAVVLTLGAAWGAYLLLRIGFLKSFTAVSLNEVNAHGHAQIFGWVGLFVMGFAYQAFPRFKHTSLAHPRLALSTLWMMLLGIVIRSGAQAFVDAQPRLLVAGVVGSILEIVAIGIFVWIICTTMRVSGKPLAFYDYYIFSALSWFLIQAVYGTVYFTLITTAPNRDVFLSLVSTWQAPLRDLQIHGFAMLMILGVSQRLFHNFYGFPAPRPGRGLAVLVLLNLSIAGEAIGFVLMRTLGHAWAALWYGAVLVMVASLVLLVWGWRLHTKPEETDRSLKFLRTAYCWLFISMAMSVFLPVYQFGLLHTFAPSSHAAEIGFSHAYYGAIRHAITVGFISMMIVGVAAKVVPTLKGLDIRGLPGLWIPFILLNLGCAIRVSFQVLTDFQDIAFPLAGISGVLEVTALGIWGVHLWRIMNGWTKESTSQAMNVQFTPITNGEAIVPGNRVSDVLDTYPHLLPVFIRFGFTPLANPVLRKTLAKRVSISGAARRLDVELETLLAGLNAAREREIDKASSTLAANEIQSA
ncbi:MAG: hypothetical protein AMXMBFR84_33520 [Candidatus Hydrogenedentota bacterium]